MTLAYDKVSRQLVETGEPDQPTYSSLADIKQDWDKRSQAIKDNWTLPDRARALAMAQLKTELTGEWAKLKQALEQKAHAELQAAWQKANPTPNVADMTPGEVQARQEVLEDIAAIADGIEGPEAKHGAGEAILDLYGRYAAQGYDIGMDAAAQRGSKYLNADQLKELQGLEDHRKPSLAEARRSLEELRASQSSNATAQKLMESTFMQATALTGEESEALVQAGQQQSDPIGRMAAGIKAAE